MLTCCTGRWMMQRISVHSWSVLQTIQANNTEEAFCVKVQRDLLLPNYPSGKQIIRRGEERNKNQIETACLLSYSLFKHLMGRRSVQGMENPHLTGLQLSAHPKPSKHGGSSALYSEHSGTRRVWWEHKGGPASHMHQSLANPAAKQGQHHVPIQSSWLQALLLTSACCLMGSSSLWGYWNALTEILSSQSHTHADGLSSSSSGESAARGSVKALSATCFSQCWLSACLFSLCSSLVLHWALPSCSSSIL